MSEVNATEVVIEASETKQAGSAVSTQAPQKATAVESDLTKVLSEVLNIRKKDENPELVTLDAYVWEQHGSRMVYFPYEMRAELNMIENVPGLIDPNSVYTDERDARFTASRRKTLQREYSSSAATVYAYTEKLLHHFELSRMPEEDEDDKLFNVMRPQILKLVAENKAYFDEKLANFRDAGDTA